MKEKTLGPDQGSRKSSEVKVSSLKKELVNPFIDAKFGNLNFQFKYLAN